jgi:RNA polymerase sigma factor (sigma-70 family)
VTLRGVWPSVGVGRREGVDEPDSLAVNVFLAHQDALVRLAFLLSGSQMAAEDTVADVFARSWAALAAGRIESPGAYLRRAVVNDLRRQARRRLRIERAAAEPGPAGDDRFDTAVAERDRLLIALRRLPRRQREVLVLRFWEDRSVAETAALLGVGVGSVKTHTHRGLEQIRAYVEDR